MCRWGVVFANLGNVRTATLSGHVVEVGSCDRNVRYVENARGQMRTCDDRRGDENGEPTLFRSQVCCCLTGAGSRKLFRQVCINMTIPLCRGSKNSNHANARMFELLSVGVWKFSAAQLLESPHDPRNRPTHRTYQRTNQTSTPTNTPTSKPKHNNNATTTPHHQT